MTPLQRDLVAAHLRQATLPPARPPASSPRTLRRTLLLAAMLIVLALLALNDPHGTAALLRSLVP